MPSGKQVSPGKQLEIARLALQGVKLKAIASKVGVHHTTVKSYRQKLLDGLEAIGVRPLCGCGQIIGHRGHCAVDRALPEDAPELADQQVLDAMAGELEAARQPTQEERRQEFAEMVGRSRGWGESERSIRERLGLSRLDLEAIKHDQTAAYNRGLHDGKARRFRAGKGKAAASHPVQKKPDASRPVRMDPVEIPTDPSAPATRRDDRREGSSTQPAPATTHVEIPTRLLSFVDQVVEHGIFGDTRTEVLAHLLQVQIGNLVKPGIVNLRRGQS